MSDDDETFRLNALNRYEKRSRLMLEAHSHCEVPAGCLRGAAERCCSG